MKDLLHRKQPFVRNLLNSNLAVQIQIMLNALDIQMRLLHRKTKKKHIIVLNNHKVTTSEIADFGKISIDRLHEYLGIRKLCSKWVSFSNSQLTKTNKALIVQSRLFSSLSKIKRITFMRYVTVDETWIHQYTPETNRQSSEWTAEDGSQPKWPKTQQIFGRFGYGVRILGCAWYSFHRVPSKRKNYLWRILYGVIDTFEERSHGKNGP